MKFSELAQYFQKLENTTSRNVMTEILARLFGEASGEEIDKICYLTQGRVAPLFVALEFGMAEKMMMKAMALAYGISEKEVGEIFKKEGDLGKAAEKLVSVIPTDPPIRRGVEESRPQPHANARSLDFARDDKNHRPLSISEVFSVLEEIAYASGLGSVERKTRLLADLLKKVDSLSACYIVRIPLAKMRLGFSDMTVLDALSWMVDGNKNARQEIEKAYNVRPDLGLMALKVKEGFEGGEGLEGLRKIEPEIGVPILMAKAERLSSGQEIIEKIGKCAIEPKLDGFRVQVHFSKTKKTRHSRNKFGTGSEFSLGSVQLEMLKQVQHDKEMAFVKLFSRNLEDVTNMYPDIVAGVVSQIKASEAIFEGEAIGWDEKKQKYLAFQETTQRRRKYNIAKMTKSVPLKLVVFDLLYVNGQNLIDKPFLQRRKRLEKYFDNCSYSPT